MSIGASFFDIIFWTYGRGSGEFLLLWLNVHWFLYHFFSVPQMLGSLFSPLKRLKDGRNRGFDPQKAVESAILNLVMRITGLLVRIMLLVIAVFAQFAAAICGALFFGLFLFWPALIVFSFYYGFFFLLN